MKHGLVISDLHLFSERSQGAALMEGMVEPMKQAGLLVLNGDIFDFRWSHHPDEESTLRAAFEWLQELIGRFEQKPIHYVRGNHDCLNAFTPVLDELAATHPSFSCHEHLLVLGRNLFLHGDCANRRMDEVELKRYRSNWSEDRRRGSFGRSLYRLADATGLSRAFHQRHFPVKATVARVAHHLDHVMPNWRQDIDHCYFGHTHCPFSDHGHGGVLFHNTGSGIRGMGFQPLNFESKTTNHQTNSHV